MTKHETLEAALLGNGCLGKAARDEPVFVLRANDKFAPIIVDIWAQLVEATRGTSEKTNSAFEIAADMRSWQHATDTAKVPD